MTVIYLSVLTSMILSEIHFSTPKISQYISMLFRQHSGNDVLNLKNVCCGDLHTAAGATFLEGRVPLSYQQLEEEEIKICNKKK
jgi:hypothetical protein